MKKVNFKKLTNQFLAGVFALTLMGGVMLNTQEAEAITLSDGWTKANFDGDFDEICKSPGKTCAPPVIIIVPTLEKL